VSELEVGYRVPGPILDFASRLLPLAAPHVAPSRSIRVDGEAPWITSAPGTDELVAAVAERSGFLAGEWTSVGVVVPRSLAGPVREALVAAGVDAAAADRGGLDHA